MTGTEILLAALGETRRVLFLFSSLKVFWKHDFI